ncbi:translation initiation factor eIF2B subunit epsilon isoform X2 [Anabrus simplex]|uniref:translation initiation factor eIF2B subunit epsilon isoform X2 n=1 Tax=Anabrus simplex TaxID=316456 RepID=UPI0035A32885
MSKKTSKAKSTTEPLQKEDVVQAVVISDNFNSWFHPMSFSKPTPLLPLVNTPLIDYTLEFLALSGVQEVILFCCSHADLIKEHIKNSKWSESTSSMVVTIIVSESCRSLGDAMRDLDAKAVIRSDFILLSGSTVANVQLIPILEHHRKFAKQDKGAVMTLIYKEAGVGHKSRSPDDETILAVDSLTDRVLFHQKLGAGNKKVTFPLETFMDNSKVDILYSLQDTHISICSPAVPPLFSDNFDFQTRDDFIRGLLLNEEILASTIYWHRLEAAEYAACVTNWHMYQAISHDVIHRWAYPLVPDSSLSTLSEPYMYLRHNVYRQKTATLSKGCVLEEDVVMAEGTTVGENTCITRSVIGKGCKIGKNVTVSNSYLWDNVVVEDNCCIDFCVVAHGAVIKSDSKLSGGCILAPGVVLGPNKQMKAAWVVASPVVIKDDFNEEEKTEMENVGEKAYLYQPPVHDSDSEDEGKASQPSRLMLDSEGEEEGEEVEDESDDMSGSNELSYRASPVPDDTNSHTRPSLFWLEMLCLLLVLSWWKSEPTVHLGILGLFFLYWFNLR